MSYYALKTYSDGTLSKIVESLNARLNSFGLSLADTERLMTYQQEHCRRARLARKRKGVKA